MWNIEVITNSDDGSGFTVLKLPSATRNISTKMNKSTSCVLSAKNVYAIAGKSKLLKYGFCKKLLRYNDDLEKKWGQKGSTGQGFIFTKETSYKIHILVCMRAGGVIFVR